MPKKARAKTKEIRDLQIQRPPRRKLTAEESLKRMEEFDERKERFIASVREGKD